MYTEQAIRKIIKEIQSKSLSTQKAIRKFKHLPYENMSFARVDHHRQLRKGLPEAVYAPGKSLKQIEALIASMHKARHAVLVTRLEKERYEKLHIKFDFLKYSEAGRLAYWRPRRARKRTKPVAIVTAGTSDITAAEEAAITLDVVGHPVKRFYDCGVAGLHRIAGEIPELNETKAIICIAGMDGALPSVLAGMVERPIIAVPTSVGYGANFKGVTPLLTMLNTCAQGVAVVNIDNGFGAACFAALLP